MLGFDLLFFAPAALIVTVAVVLIRRERSDRDVEDTCDVPKVDAEFLRASLEQPVVLGDFAPVTGAESLGGRLQVATIEAARHEAAHAGRVRLTARRRRTPLVASR